MNDRSYFTVNLKTRGGFRLRERMGIGMGGDNAAQHASASGALNRCGACGCTCATDKVPKPRLSTTRRSYADVAAEVLALAMSLFSGSWTRWADRLGITRQVAQRFASAGGPRVAVGDILMLEPEISLTYLAALQQRIKGSMKSGAAMPALLPLDALDRRVSIEQGRLTEAIDAALSDGHLSAAERKLIAERAAALVCSAENVVAAVEPTPLRRAS